MTHVANNPHEEKARLVKAYALADALSGWEHQIDMIAIADKEWWNKTAKVAKVNPPSQATIDLTISIIRRRAASSTGSDDTAASGSPTANDDPSLPIPTDRPAADPFEGLQQDVHYGHQSL